MYIYIYIYVYICYVYMSIYINTEITDDSKNDFSINAWLVVF